MLVEIKKMKNYPENENDELKWLHHVRRTELKIIEEILQLHKNAKILEIGGGDGFQAKVLSDDGFSITSIDIEPRSPQVFPVEKIVSTKLNFLDETFDIVFTSHVLPHIYNLEQMFDEIKRVIKKDGLIVHIVPTSGWSFITNIWHYLFIPKYLLKSIKKRISKNLQPQTCSVQKIETPENFHYKIQKLFLHPLGENPSFIHELIYFSHRHWEKLFLDSGFKIIDVKNGPYLTSGYGVFRFKLISFRKIFAKYFFPSSYCFILKI